MSYSVELRNAKLAANATIVGSAGVLKIFAGTKPATGGADGTLLATFALASPFAPAPSAGVQLPTLPANVTAVATNTAGWARVTKTDGTTAVMDLTVGIAASGMQVILNTLSITSGGTVSVTGFTITAADA